eukprot:TRINITY_DN3601_c0_g4_i1.p2 TRINITY_DN3601_c0_g4~~TRINITY_DN3601_c0_g4_i1.p2  ORF type:complete len:152 (-),score=13.16 TRINITY_DN3601_c0_g4_i1:553-954(-)
MTGGRGSRQLPPSLIRVGINRHWDSFWYSSYYQRDLVAQDINMHKYFQQLADHIDYGIPPDASKKTRDPILHKRDNPGMKMFIQRMAKRTTAFTFSCTPILEEGFFSKKRTFEQIKKAELKKASDVPEEERDE